jgi:hypothetical protein
MNDLTETENELKKLRPIAPSAELSARIESAIHNETLINQAASNVIQPDGFRIVWAIGFGLAAAAMWFLFVRVNFQPAGRAARLSAISPSPAIQSPAPAPVLRDEFLPAGATQVVYHTRDEGLIFPRTSQEPVRRLRSHTRETLQWHNAATGASLRVSYPSEQVELIPVSGQ